MRKLPPRDPEAWIHRVLDKYRKGKRPPLEFRPSAAFFELADEAVNDDRTFLGYDRLYVLWQAIRNLASVPGAAAEIGTYRGGSAFFIASALVRVTGAEVPMHVIDTFEGHPADAMTSHDEFHQPGQFSATSYEQVREYLAPFRQLRLHKGNVATVLPGFEEMAYRLVHIDTDLFQPTVACLDYFGPRMSPGGVIVVDDYDAPKCPGVPKAVLEYMTRVSDFQVWDMRTEQLVLIKR